MEGEMAGTDLRVIHSSGAAFPKEDNNAAGAMKRLCTKTHD